jgi:trk system potassium uptake protein TrkH
MFKTLQKIKPVFYLLDIAALLMLFPLTFAAALNDRIMVRAFALPLAGVLLLTIPILLLLRKSPVRFTPRDGFLLVFAAWTFCILLGTFPYWLSQNGISFVDALFESSCGFATTGATTIADIEALPRPLLLWRAMTHWFGGRGIVLLTVALMPLIGVGGFQLIKAETPGPEKEKITPKAAVTAKFLWLIYCTLTVILFLLYRLGGMGWFDALCHAFPVIASGGISTKNAGLAFFNSPFIDIVSIIFMILAGLNFNLYYRLLRGKFREVFTNSEGRAYLFIFFAASAVISWALIPVYGSLKEALRYGFYQTASILSTTGLVAADYSLWPPITHAIILALMICGGCSGSTAGGIKIIRHVVLWKQARNEMQRIINPRGVFNIRLNGKVGRRDVVYCTAGFICIYFLTVGITALVTAASAKVDVLSSLSVALAITGNIGLGFGAFGPFHNYSAIPAFLKYFYSFIMIAGRLELWTVLAVLSPMYSIGGRRRR